MTALSDVILLTGTDGNLYTIKPDGTGLTDIYSGTTMTSAAASPDGSRIVALDGSTAYVMAADGTGVMTITNISGNACLARGATWSPDGAKFMVPYSGPGVDIINADNSGHVEVPISGLRNFSSVYWSPDGTKILFAVFSVFPKFNGVGVCAIDGSGGSVPFSDTTYDYQPFGWYPDSAHFLLNRTLQSGAYPVDVMKSDGTTLYSDATGANITSMVYAGGDLGAPQALSPDGTEVVFWDNATSGISVLSSGITSLFNPPPTAENDFLQWVPTAPLPAVGSITAGAHTTGIVRMGGFF